MKTKVDKPGKIDSWIINDEITGECIAHVFEANGQRERMSFVRFIHATRVDNLKQDKWGDPSQLLIALEMTDKHIDDAIELLTAIRETITPGRED